MIIPILRGSLRTTTPDMKKTNNTKRHYDINIKEPIKQPINKLTYLSPQNIIATTTSRKHYQQTTDDTSITPRKSTTPKKKLELSNLGFNLVPTWEKPYIPTIKSVRTISQDISRSNKQQSNQENQHNQLNQDCQSSRISTLTDFVPRSTKSNNYMINQTPKKALSEISTNMLDVSNPFKIDRQLGIANTTANSSRISFPSSKGNYFNKNR